MASWGFYGRRSELAEVQTLLDRDQFFFCSISGRRRIGKTSLIQEALRRKGQSRRALYVQIPDSDERGVIQVFEDAVEDILLDQDFARNTCGDFSDIAALLRVLWRSNFITAIDEFQYFHRKTLSPFLSYLQYHVDDARAKDSKGGMFALGSIHTEMTAVLEDKDSPLFNRVTHRIKVGHWDFETLFEMFREHGIDDPHHRLFLWSIFEGVPKFYRDCFDNGALVGGANYRYLTLDRMFFEGASPLKDEAENWFLRELRGRYDSVLKLVARMGPCSHGLLKAEYDRTGPGGEKQLGGYLKILIDKYQMIERVNPVFSKDHGRKARYQITDNFLAAWLAAIARNVQLARVRPVNEAIARADESLKTHEGYAFETMVRLILEECSRKNVGDFSLTQLVRGYWNKPDGTDIEIDVVAINDIDKVIRVGSCKRSASKHDTTSLYKFNEHIERFKKTELGKKYSDWTVERALYAPVFDERQRNTLTNEGYICVDMDDFDQWLSLAK
tara:strand:- start:5856 stop:7358 length:1503 start_codon:yes stop_codon:yes gene_type:complete